MPDHRTLALKRHDSHDHVTSDASSPLARGKAELFALLVLALPLCTVYLGQMLIGVVGTAVAGRLGEIALGASGLGNSLFFALALLGLGIMLGLDPLISQAIGARESALARRLLHSSVWLALALTLPLGAAILAVSVWLERLGIDPRAAEVTRRYVFARLPGLAPFLVFVGLRSYLQAIGVTRPLVVSVVLANAVNLPLSWALTFGDAGLVAIGLPALGVPALDVAGAAWANTLATLVQMLVLAEAARRIATGSSTRTHVPTRALLARTLRLGIPIGFQLLAEVGVFSLVNVIMGNIDARALASHQVAITLASATFMVPVAIGAATSVRVGHAVGRGDAPAARLAGVVGIATGAVFMLCSALTFLLAPELLARLITNQPGVIAAALPLVLVAAVFQLSDGVQAVAAGALRGAGDTRVALAANLGGHYLIGLPLGLLCAFRWGLGAQGLWWGLSAGLTVVACVLTARVVRVTSRPVERA